MFIHTDVVSRPLQESSPPVVMTTQSVIRPIPILPLDASIYSSPPTYIDNLPPNLSVPLIPSELIGNHAVKREITELPDALVKYIDNRNRDNIPSKVVFLWIFFLLFPFFLIFFSLFLPLILYNPTYILFYNLVRIHRMLIAVRKYFYRMLCHYNQKYYSGIDMPFTRLYLCTFMGLIVILCKIISWSSYFLRSCQICYNKCHCTVYIESDTGWPVLVIYSFMKWRQ